MVKATPGKSAKPARTNFKAPKRKSARKPVPGLYSGSGSNTLTGALSQIKASPAGSKAVLPTMQPSTVGNMGDSAPVGKIRKGMF